MKWVNEGFLEEAGVILKLAVKDAYKPSPTERQKRTFQTEGRRETKHRY